MTTPLTRRSLLAATGATALAVPVVTLPAASQQSEPENAAPIHVLTAHPAAFALVTALTKGSSLTVEAVQPARLPATRLTSFLSGRGRETLAQAASRAAAVVTFRSFWPQDPLYPHARRTNIRIVEIDAGRPLDGALPGIAIAEPTDDGAIYAAFDLQPMPPTGESSAPWLSPTSMGRMADVLAADLSRLDPTSAETITSNLAALKQRLLALKAKADIDLAEADSLSAIALSPHFAYLAADFGMELLASITAAPGEWSPERAIMLAEWLKANAIEAVLLDAVPNGDLAGGIRQAGARFAVLTTIEGETNDPANVIESNVRALIELFGGGSR